MESNNYKVLKVLVDAFSTAASNMDAIKYRALRDYLEMSEQGLDRTNQETRAVLERAEKLLLRPFEECPSFLL